MGCSPPTYLPATGAVPGSWSHEKSEGLCCPAEVERGAVQLCPSLPGLWSGQVGLILSGNLCCADGEEGCTTATKSDPNKGW